MTTALTTGSAAALPIRAARSLREVPAGPNSCSQSSAGCSVRGPSRRKTATILRGFDSSGASAGAHREGGPAKKAAKAALHSSAVENLKGLFETPGLISEDKCVLI